MHKKNLQAFPQYSLFKDSFVAFFGPFPKTSIQSIVKTSKYMVHIVFEITSCCHNYDEIHQAK